MQQFDLAIVGGGMAGVTAALAYAQLGFSIALIEAVQPELDTSPSFDERAVALSAASVKIFQSLGLWSAIEPLACPIEKIHVSNRGHMGFTRLNADQHRLSSFGQVISLNQAGPVLWQQLVTQPLIKVFCPARLNSVNLQDSCCQLEFSQTNSQQPATIEAKLVLAADGTFSPVAKMMGITTKREPYHQHAVICNVQTQQPHQNRAFERFTNTGPLALLPLPNNQMSLVWCHKPDDVDKVMSYDDTEFLQALQEAFGYRLGHFIRASKRVQYPLKLHLAQQHYGPRILLLGNSAHTLHPVAGQGFNLGLRDIAALNDLLKQAKVQKEDFACEAFLQGYVNSRSNDWRQTITATDSLARLFTRTDFPLVFARNKAMTLINWLPFARQKLIDHATGYGARSSDLARGITNKKFIKSEFHDI